jgi:membrane-associated protein
VDYLQLILKLDVFINLMAEKLGPSLYTLIFFIIFAETGLVFMPFLPGDSLLFAIGALSASSSFFHIEVYIPLLISASIIGDSTNYWVGRKIGRKLFENPHFFSKLFNVRHLEKTEQFYKKRGALAVVVSRFIPIVRTLAPFVAGLTVMPYRYFVMLSALGSVVWISLFTLAGYYFGQIEIIKNNFTLLMMGIVALSLLPMVIGLLKCLLDRTTLKKNT